MSRKKKTVEWLLPEDYNKAWEKDYKEARSVRILTLVGRKYLEDIEDVVKRAKEAEKFKFAILNPMSPHWFVQYRDFEPLPGVDIDVVGHQVHAYQKIVSRFNEIKKALSELNSPDKIARYYFIKPVFRIEIFDSVAYIAFYGLRSRGVYSPHLRVVQGVNQELFSYFERQFQLYWETGESTFHF